MKKPQAHARERGETLWDPALLLSHSVPTAEGGTGLADGPLEVLHRSPTRCLLREPTPFGPIGWVVHELACADLPGSRAERCLVFEAPNAMRRVYDFPPDWHTLPAAALLALSWRR